MFSLHHAEDVVGNGYGIKVMLFSLLLMLCSVTVSPGFCAFKGIQNSEESMMHRRRSVFANNLLAGM